MTATDRAPRGAIVTAAAEPEEVARPGAGPRSWSPPAWVVACVAVVVVLSAVVVGLGMLVAPPKVPGLQRAGAFTDVGGTVSQVASRVLALTTVGALLLAAVLVPGGPRHPASNAGRSGRDLVRQRATRVGAGAAAGWALTALVGAAFQVAQLTAIPVQSLPAEALVSFALEVPLVQAAGLVVVLATAAAVAATVLPARRASATALLPAVAALVVPQMLSGHSSSSPDHVLAVTLLSVHVLVATTWVGGLGALVLLARRSPVLPQAAARFSVVALVCFVSTGATGVAAAWVLLQGVVAVPDLIGSDYGALLAAKTAAFVLVGAAGWWHRHRTLPALRRGVPRSFLRFAAVETVVLLLATGLAVTLAGTAPPTPAAAGPPTSSAPGTSQPDPPVDAAPGASAVEDMSGHDHGELTVSVLVDGDRYHVAGPVDVGQRVTVFNSSTGSVTLTARDGSFDVEVASGSLTTFTAPLEPGRYAFTSRDSTGYSDVLVVQAP